jgi:DNA topoisomerase-3
VFYPACEYDQTKVVTEAEGEHFRSTGRTERVAGWKEVYRGVGKPDKKEAEPPLPPLSEGDERKVEKAAVKKETTKPPAPHTDASLLAAMENAGRDLDDEALREQMKGSGLGTPATRAAIIERLLQVGYAERKGKTIQATPKGVALIGICPQELASPETTGKWELALNEIAANKRDTERFMQGIRRLSEFLVSYAKSTTVEGGFPEETRRGKRGSKAGAARKQDLLEDAACPLCGKPVKESEKAFGCSNWQNGCAFTLWKDCLTRGGGPALNDRLVSMLLKDHSVRGSTGTVVLEDGQIRFVPKEQGGQTVSCPIAYKKK